MLGHDRPLAMQSTAVTSIGHITRFIVFIGLTSLFADMTYEGSRAITGPFPGTLGATGAMVATIAGAGELVGYGLRWGSGCGRSYRQVLGDYVVRLRRQSAGGARSGPGRQLAGCGGADHSRAQRQGHSHPGPRRDAVACRPWLGRTGWAFELHEAMDQTGATIGPLIVAGILWLRGRRSPRNCGR